MNTAISLTEELKSVTGREIRDAARTLEETPPNHMVLQVMEDRNLQRMYALWIRKDNEARKAEEEYRQKERGHWATLQRMSRLQREIFSKSMPTSLQDLLWRSRTLRDVANTFWARFLGKLKDNCALWGVEGLELHSGWKVTTRCKQCSYCNQRHTTEEPTHRLCPVPVPGTDPVLMAFGTSGYDPSDALNRLPPSLDLTPLP